MFFLISPESQVKICNNRYNHWSDSTRNWFSEKISINQKKIAGSDNACEFLILLENMSSSEYSCQVLLFFIRSGAVVIAIVWLLDLSVQSVHITTKFVSSKPVHGKVYSIKHYVIKSDLWQVGGFLLILRFPPPIKLTRHDITEILLKVALNTINQTFTNLIRSFRRWR